MNNKQAKVMMAAFVYFSIVMEKKGMLDEIPPKIKRVFKKLATITKMYQSCYKFVLKEINDILAESSEEVDFMLLSVSIIAEYYEQLKGKRTEFHPMSYKEILTLQDECIEMNDTNVSATFDVAELIVQEILK